MAASSVDDVNPLRKPGQVHLITIMDRDYLTMLSRRLATGHALEQHRDLPTGLCAERISGLDGFDLGRISSVLVAGHSLVRKTHQTVARAQLTQRRTTAEGLQSASLPVPESPDELRRLTRTYNALTQRLAQSWSQQRQFVSAVSHELQTPLTLVSGLRRVIRKAPDLEPTLAQRLRDAEEDPNMQLLNDSLDLPAVIQDTCR